MRSRCVLSSAGVRVGGEGRSDPAHRQRLQGELLISRTTRGHPPSASVFRYVYSSCTDLTACAGDALSADGGIVRRAPKLGAMRRVGPSASLACQQCTTVLQRRMTPQAYSRRRREHACPAALDGDVCRTLSGWGAGLGGVVEVECDGPAQR